MGPCPEAYFDRGCSLYGRYSTAEKEKDGDSPKPTTDIAKYKAVGDEEKEDEKQGQ